MCGNGVREEGEPCDPSTTLSGCAANLVCGAVGTPDACRCVPPRSEEPAEICGNCVDDNGNGLTDFEDPACCPESRTFQMTVNRLRIRQRRGFASRLRLRSILAQSGLRDVNPLVEDVFLQIRPAQGLELLCAKVPAPKFMRMHGAFKFWDHAHSTASAKGLDDMTVKVPRDGRVRLRTVGHRVQMETPGAGQLQVTVGFRNPATGEGQNRCSIGFPTFQP